MGHVIAVIPARSGSKGVLNKNIKLLAGEPLMAYSIMAARLSASIDRVIVSTDSGEYADIAKKYGAEVPFLRPPEISSDKSTDYEFIIHLISYLKTNSVLPDFIVLLRPTTPFRDVAYIDMAIELVEKNKNATALRSAHEMGQSAYKTVEIENNVYKSICDGSTDMDKVNRPRQCYPVTYDLNGYVDVFRTSYILKNKRLLGDNVLSFITPFISEVDTIDEFEYMKFQVNKNPNLVDRIFRYK